MNDNTYEADEADAFAVEARDFLEGTLLPSIKDRLAERFPENKHKQTSLALLTSLLIIDVIGSQPQNFEAFVGLLDKSVTLGALGALKAEA